MPKVFITLSGKVALAISKNEKLFSLFPKECPHPLDDAQGFSEYINTHPEVDWERVIKMGCL